jgi:hypothetical protein
VLWGVWAVLAVGGWVAVFVVFGTEDDPSPATTSRQSVVGFWVHGDRTLLLAGDGTFESRLGCHGTDGTWRLADGAVELAVDNEIVGSCPQSPGALTPEDPRVRGEDLVGYLRFDELEVPNPDDLVGRWRSSAGETVIFREDGRLTGVCPVYLWEMEDGVLQLQPEAPTPCPPPRARSATAAFEGEVRPRLYANVLFLRGESATARLARAP